MVLQGSLGKGEIERDVHVMFIVLYDVYALVLYMISYHGAYMC